jgi:ribonuclease-3 family protein
MFFTALSQEEALMLDPLVLAFVGDGVYTLYVRAHLAGSGKKTGGLHKDSVRYVSAYGQAEAFDAVYPALTEEERDICRRARNHHNRTAPKNTDLETYKKATALEALVGYYYLVRDESRLEQILRRSVCPE